MISPVVLAGGLGLRLWPVSTPSLPKPFLRLPGHALSLLQQTLERVNRLDVARPPLVVGNVAHAARLEDEIRSVAPGARLLLEPEPRGTAPALCAAALTLLDEGADDPMLVLPSDHLISGDEAFASAVANGAALAAEGYLVTFSVRPTYAATGYGYLARGRPISQDRGMYRVDHFVEKPDAAVAESFLVDGSFGWNSGIFMFRPSALLAALDRLEPGMETACRAALPPAVDRAPRILSGSAFARARTVSIDHAVMERSANIATVLARFDWSDVGDWEAVRLAVATDDSGGNVAGGDALLEGGHDSLAYSSGPPVIGIGLEHMLVVATPDAVLVAPRTRAQEVRSAAAMLGRLKRCHESGPWHDERPWGSFDVLRSGDGYKVKELTINPHGILSLQRHRHRAEHWVCVAGRGLARTGENMIPIAPGSVVSVPQGALHRLVNTGNETLRIVEVQIGAETAEDDIERLEDAYGRA